MARERIVILGGGLGSLSTAFELTSDPTWRDRFEITIYQSGWLLGGKAASVRNRHAANRIEEHGLHVFLGFYDNAIAMMRRCYEELERPATAPLARFEHAFKPHDHLDVCEPFEGAMHTWRITLPRNRAVAGEPPLMPDAGERFRLAVAWAEIALDLLREAAGGATTVRARIRWGIVASEMAALGLAAAALYPRVVDAIEGTASTSAIDEAAVGALDTMRRRLRTALNVPGNFAAWRLWLLLDFVATNLIGATRDQILDGSREFSDLDGEEYRAWLARHGASGSLIASGLVRGLYGIAFAHDDGCAAGSGLRGTIRFLFGYKGAAFLKMQAGMGETVIAPLYQVLRRRGVRFELFHRVDAIRLDPNANTVNAVELTRTASTHSGHDYEPLVDVGGLPCWPEAPLSEQLVSCDPRRGRHDSTLDDASGQPVRLSRGRDFDRVVLAIAVGALPAITKDLSARSARWHSMVTGVKTVRTAALQVWHDQPLASLGAEPEMLRVSYTLPFDSWADMSHLLPLESWSGARGLSYLCGPLGNAADPPVLNVADRDAADADLAKQAVAWWSEHGPRWLSRAGQGLGEVARYVRSNGAPSDRYVLSVAGTTRFRLPAHESGFDNLLLAGDWVRTGIDLGCVEAAVVSGRQVARALIGDDREIHGELAAFARGGWRGVACV